MNKFGSLLSEFHSNSVHDQENINHPEAWVDATLSTFEGLVVNIRAFENDGIAYAAFNVNYDQSKAEAADPAISGELKPVVNKLNQRLSGWIFEIPNFKYEILSRKLASLLIDPASGEKTDGL